MSGVELKMFTKMKDHVVEAVEETLGLWLQDAYQWPWALMLVGASGYQQHSTV